MPTANAKLHISERDKLENYAAELGGAAGPVELTTAFVYMLDNLDVAQAIEHAKPARSGGDWSRIGVNLTDEQHTRLESVQAALSKDRSERLGFEDEVSINQTVRFVIRNFREDALPAAQSV